MSCQRGAHALQQCHAKWASCSKLTERPPPPMLSSSLHDRGRASPKRNHSMLALVVAVIADAPAGGLAQNAAASCQQRSGSRFIVPSANPDLLGERLRAGRPSTCPTCREPIPMHEKGQLTHAGPPCGGPWKLLSSVPSRARARASLLGERRNFQAAPRWELVSLASWYAHRRIPSTGVQARRSPARRTPFTLIGFGRVIDES